MKNIQQIIYFQRLYCHHIADSPRRWAANVKFWWIYWSNNRGMTVLGRKFYLDAIKMWKKLWKKVDTVLQLNTWKLWLTKAEAVLITTKLNGFPESQTLNVHRVMLPFPPQKMLLASYSILLPSCNFIHHIYFKQANSNQLFVSVVSEEPFCC